MAEAKEFSFKIVAGELKGKQIKSPDIGVTRPPLSRVRKSIFDFLNPYLPNASYFDLFSGSGSYLFEAVSRGVGLAVGIEMEFRLVDSINRQAAMFGVKEKLNCLCGDVFELVGSLTQQFDIVMIAPPQYRGLIDKTLAGLHNSHLLKPASLILCQHDSRESKKIDFSLFSILQLRKYGNTTFTILQGR